MVAALWEDADGRVGMAAAQPTTGQVYHADSCFSEDEDVGPSSFELRRWLELLRPLEVLLPRYSNCNAFIRSS